LKFFNDSGGFVMKKGSVLTMVMVGLSGALGGCGGNIGGDCTYVQTPGTATIVSVESSDGWCADAVVVTFDFVADDGAADVQTGTITIAAGDDPPLSWVEDEGLTEGSTHDMVREDIDKGTCSPLLYTLTNVDYDAALDAC
jgi:hypothetical protein